VQPPALVVRDRSIASPNSPTSLLHRARISGAAQPSLVGMTKTIASPNSPTSLWNLSPISGASQPP
jgi:hypothetical protein